MSLFNELKRRNVIRVGTAYVVVAWLLIQVAETVFPLFGFDDTPARIVVILLAVGFVPALIFAWAFELTPEGLKKEKDIDPRQSITPHTGKKLDRMIMVVLAMALAFFAFDKFVLDPTRDATLVQSAFEEGRSEALVESFGDHSIAVLPFADMSAASDQEYFSDGMAEELLNLLAKIPELRVISRSSAFSFKGKDLSIPEIASRLNVAHILDGSVRKAGDRLRVQVQLIEARSDTHLWSETFDRTLDDIFAVQDEIAAAVVDALKVNLLGVIPELRQTNPEVYSLYLQGNYFNNRRGEENLEKAIEAFEQALTIDPDFAPAWVGISQTYSLQIFYGLRPRDEGSDLALEAVERALTIDDEMAWAWASLAYLKRSYLWDWQGARTAIERALQLEPNNVDVRGVAASLANTFGQIDVSIDLFEQNVRLDPLRLRSLRALGSRYLKSDRFDEAIDTFGRVLALNPEYPRIHMDLARAYLLKGDPERALIEIDKDSTDAQYPHVKALILFSQGKEAESHAIIEEILRSPAPKRPLWMAADYAWLGENDSAFEWLEEAYQQRDGSLAFILGAYFFENLSSDPRYPVFLEKLGLLEAWQAMPPEAGGPPR